MTHIGKEPNIYTAQAFVHININIQVQEQSTYVDRNYVEAQHSKSHILR